MRILARHTAAQLLTILVGLGALCDSAWAQQFQPGVALPLMTFYVRGVDTASDAQGNHLIVGGQGKLLAACVNPQGGVISPAISISATGGYASFPRVAYSPSLNYGAGGFLVAWAEAPWDPAGNVMRGLFTRWVSCSGAAGPPQMVSPSVWWEPGNIAIAHSRTSQNFLIAWQIPGTRCRQAWSTSTARRGAPSCHCQPAWAETRA